MRFHCNKMSCQAITINTIDVILVSGLPNGLLEMISEKAKDGRRRERVRIVPGTEAHIYLRQTSKF